MTNSRKVVVLKARQLGLSWLSLSQALWQMIFRPPATILLFSLREHEACDLLRRLYGMYAHLPANLQAMPTVRRTANDWVIENGSRAIAFSTRGGRSYTGTLAIVDEADFVPNLADFLNAVKPTIDGDGSLLLISTADKSRPLSTFKRIFRSAARGENDFRAIFLPWHARPDRTEAWHRRIAAEMRAQRGSDDDFFQEYPATVEEALRVRSLAARIPASLIEAITDLREPLPIPNLLLGEVSQDSLYNPTEMLRLFAAPDPAGSYAIGADPAEGNPRRDASVATVLDAATGEQVAILAGALEPERFAGLCVCLADYYNHAPLLVERNNHGHTVLAWLRDEDVTILRGLDGKPGWLTTATSKSLLYDALAMAVREQAITLRDDESAAQLASIDALTLRAPVSMHDDRAMALALAWRACEAAAYVASAPIPPVRELF